MTPKEKAQELFDKYFEIEGLGYYRDKHSFMTWSTNIIGKQIKQCISILVDEIIKETSIRGGENDEIIIPNKYWVEVKKQIKEL